MIFKDEIKLRQTCKECGWEIINWGVKKLGRTKEYDWFALEKNFLDPHHFKEFYLDQPTDFETLYSSFLEKMGPRKDKVERFFVRGRYAPENRYPAISITKG